MEIRTYSSSETGFNDALEVRKNVFVVEQQIPEEEEIDALENESLHFVLYDDHTPVGASRLRSYDNGGKVERVCILKDWRKKGLGEELMKAMEKEAERLGYSSLLLNAQTQAEDFYKKLGYATVSAHPFLDAGIPHVAMKKKLVP
ncbi:GNAT family N-acetyltransferase [Fictibacillus aquaticus]|uniref:GNAT family N-acetyltransferase n=1 Tax=Fictibacillus aquaticus TaxID=2021314 RepID=A0A235FCV3_9BACL|nr:GNAT family N-acetyltransferase [Fictibacillus aquaticus]OYD59029.1 GNAT family N-acetyltransferase [Fictibacillus aquaticus]